MFSPKIAHNRLFCIFLCTFLSFQAVGCGSGSGPAMVQADPENYVEPTGQGTRDNTPVCLVPSAPGTETYGNDLVLLDASNKSEGYITIEYLGTCSKIKLQITCPSTTTYTYTLTTGQEVFPLTKDSGTYQISVFENIQGTQYATAFSETIDVDIADPLKPYLYPNQYVNFSEADLCIAKGEALAAPCDTDLDVVSNIYNYIINRIVYDHEKAETVQSGYLPHPDETLTTGKGICLDYSALMASMLRSQRIPTHMEIGYAGTVYHAWISTYITDVGWVNGIIQFDGEEWSLMDPTFASSASNAKDLKEFIGDGSNYEVKFIY